MPILASIFGFLTSTVSSLFGFKGDQAKTVQSAIDTLKSMDASDTATISAHAQAITAILTQGSWLEQNWRPFLMLLLMLIIGCWFFGLVPPNFDEPVSPMMTRIIDLLTIGVAGYIPARTIDKAIQQWNIGSILKALIEKKFS